MAGGFTVDIPTATAELYDPATGTWTATGDMTAARSYHTATLLPDGKVLVAGGQGWSGSDYPLLDSAEIYDPVAGTWAATGKMAHPRLSFTTTLLANGKVLATGGFAAPAPAELFDPASGTWAATGSRANSVPVTARRCCRTGACWSPVA